MREKKASSVHVDRGFSKKKSHTSPTHTREQVVAGILGNRDVAIFPKQWRSNIFVDNFPKPWT